MDRNEFNEQDTRTKRKVLYTQCAFINEIPGWKEKHYTHIQIGTNHGVLKLLKI
jgi:hypothetical protein